jgi:transposase InsO family protein
VQLTVLANGKLERWHGSLKQEHWRLACAESLDDARRIVSTYVEHYNRVRLHSALGYVTPADKLPGLAQVIHDERDRKLETARERRRQSWRAAREVA